MNDPRLVAWRTKHRPNCPVCRRLSLPPIECARVWAPEWASKVWPVDELADPTLEENIELRSQLDDLRTKHARTIMANAELQREVEQLRREAFQLRESATEDFEAAHNWKRFVATVGESRASIFLVPPAKEQQN